MTGKARHRFPLGQSPDRETCGSRAQSSGDTLYLLYRAVSARYRYSRVLYLALYFSHGGMGRGHCIAAVSAVSL
eukprot:1185165-Prymnesium_polylepis.1